MILRDGRELPDEILIGLTQGEWPLKFFYDGDPDRRAAEWLDDQSLPNHRRSVFRVRLEPIHEVVLIPPVPARVEAKPVVPIRMAAES